MRAILVGCGRAGAELATRLARAGHAVTVIDVDAAAFDNLPADFLGHVIQAEVLDEDVLAHAGIEQADCVAALTNSDALNAVIGHIAESVFHVPRVAVRAYDPRRAPVYAAFGLETVDSVQWSAVRFEQLLLPSGLAELYRAHDAGFAIYEWVVPDTWSGRTLDELTQEVGAVVTGITRAGQGLLPTPGWRLEAGDQIALSVPVDGAARLRARLGQGA